MELPRPLPGPRLTGLACQSASPPTCRGRRPRAPLRPGAESDGGGRAGLTAVSCGRRWGTHQHSAQGAAGQASRGDDQQTPTCCRHSRGPRHPGGSEDTATDRQGTRHREEAVASGGCVQEGFRSKACSCVGWRARPGSPGAGRPRQLSPSHPPDSDEQVPGRPHSRQGHTPPGGGDLGTCELLEGQGGPPGVRRGGRGARGLLASPAPSPGSVRAGGHRSPPSRPGSGLCEISESRVSSDRLCPLGAAQGRPGQGSGQRRPLLKPNQRHRLTPGSWALRWLGR